MTRSAHQRGAGFALPPFVPVDVRAHPPERWVKGFAHCGACLSDFGNRGELIMTAETAAAFKIAIIENTAMRVVVNGVEVTVSAREVDPFHSTTDQVTDYAVAELRKLRWDLSIVQPIKLFIWI